jgi:hypothetical protein
VKMSLKIDHTSFLYTQNIESEPSMAIHSHRSIKSSYIRGLFLLVAPLASELKVTAATDDTSLYF